MKIKLLLFFLVYINLFVKSQITAFQDTWNGGVKSVSFGVGMGIGNGFVDLSIPNGSVLRKVFMITESQRSPDSSGIKINNILIELDSLNLITEVQHSLNSVNPVRIYSYDITSLIFNMNLTNISISISSTCSENINCGFSLCTFVVLYENPSYSKTSCNLQIPNKNLYGHENYSISNINPINNNFPVTLSVNLTRICDTIIDGTIISLNGNLIGEIYGENLGNEGMCNGSQGQFTYENNNLVALSDDNSDFQMNGVDALSNIQNIVSNNAISFNLLLEHDDQLTSPG